MDSQRYEIERAEEVSPRLRVPEVIPRMGAENVGEAIFNRKDVAYRNDFGRTAGKNESVKHTVGGRRHGRCRSGIDERIVPRPGPRQFHALVNRLIRFRGRFEERFSGLVSCRHAGPVR